VTFPFFGATGSSLGGACRSLNKPVKGNNTACSSYGVTCSSFDDTGLLLVFSFVTQACR
jgi:hypothetical protein